MWTTLLWALRRVSGYQLVCIGHSLGANVAAVLALLLREGEVPSIWVPSEGQGVQTECDEAVPPAMRQPIAYAIGASPTVSSELASRCSPFVLSVARNMDYVNRLSAFNIDRLVLELTENSASKKAKQWFLGVLGREEARSQHRGSAGLQRRN